MTGHTDVPPPATDLKPMPIGDKILIGMFCALSLGAGLAIGGISEEMQLSREQDKVRAERRQMVSDMADAMDKVCADATAKPTDAGANYRCFGAFELFLEVDSIQDQRIMRDSWGRPL